MQGFKQIKFLFTDTTLSTDGYSQQVEYWVEVTAQHHRVYYSMTAGTPRCRIPTSIIQGAAVAHWCGLRERPDGSLERAS